MKINVDFVGNKKGSGPIVIGSAGFMSEYDLEKWEFSWPYFCSRMAKGLHGAVREQGIDIRTELA